MEGEITMFRPTIQATDTKSFFGLPAELRTLVYYLCSRHIGELGCTKVLCLCSKTYVEAIGWYRDHKVARLKIDGNGMGIFRHPKDFGMPGRFAHDRPSTRCFVPQQYSELQIMRFNNIALQLKFPSVDEDTQRGWRKIDFSSRMRKIQDNVQEVLQVLEKGRLRQITIEIARESPIVHTNKAHPPMKQLICGILALAARKKLKVLVKINRDADDPEPLVDFCLARAQQLYIETEIVHSQPVEPWPQDSRTLPATLADCYGWDNSFTYAGHVIEPYQLVPECRTCLKPFASHMELENHLFSHPKHRQPFRWKRWNRLCQSSLGHGGPRVCWTCAKGYESVSMLEKHKDDFGHWRYGIIPRYCQDNNFYDRKWYLFQKRHGWL